MPGEAERQKEILGVINELEAALERFVVKIGPPLYIAEKDKPRFRYPKRTSLILQVLNDRC